MKQLRFLGFRVHHQFPLIFKLAKLVFCLSVLVSSVLLYSALLLSSVLLCYTPRVVRVPLFRDRPLSFGGLAARSQANFVRLIEDGYIFLFLLLCALRLGRPWPLHGRSGRAGLWMSRADSLAQVRYCQYLCPTSICQEFFCVLYVAAFAGRSMLHLLGDSGYARPGQSDIAMRPPDARTLHHGNAPPRCLGTVSPMPQDPR